MGRERQEFLPGSCRASLVPGTGGWTILQAAGLLALLPILFGATSGLALRSDFSSADLRPEDGQVAELIAGYPASTRRAALIVAGYPEELLEIQQVQSRSAADFARLVSAYPQPIQDQIWRLVRYPGLAEELVRGGRKSSSELEAISARYPSEDRAAIMKEGRERYRSWVEIRALELEVEQTFRKLLSDQPEEVRSAFDVVAARPDLMSALIEHMHMTTVLGAYYRDDPSGVEADFAALHLEVAARKTEEERVWADEVADPESAQELDLAARAFADAHGYLYLYEDEAGYEDGYEEQLELGSQSIQNIYIENRYGAYPYPYWFGYPYWYSAAYWYPRPIWGHVGFRVGRGRGFVSIGLPSPYYRDWYRRSYAAPHHRGDRHHKGGRHGFKTYGNDSNPEHSRHATQRRKNSRRQTRDDEGWRSLRSASFFSNSSTRRSKENERTANPAQHRAGSRLRGRPQTSQQTEQAPRRSETRRSPQRVRSSERRSVDRSRNERPKVSTPAKQTRPLLGGNARRSERRSENRIGKLDRRKAGSVKRNHSDRRAGRSAARPSQKKAGKQRLKASSRSRSGSSSSSGSRQRRSSSSRR